MKCVVCGLHELEGRQTMYCSKNCERKGWREANKEKLLEGKRRYREAHKQEIALYHKAYKAAVKHVKQSIADNLKAAYSCLRCATKKDLEVHHIRHQLIGGGVNDLNNLLVLCKPCHALWHKMFDESYFAVNKDLARAIENEYTYIRKETPEDYKLPPGVKSIIPPRETR